MITIIDENNLVTEDGVGLVSVINNSNLCGSCYLLDSSCTGAPCTPSEREDCLDVIFVEKNE